VARCRRCGAVRWAKVSPDRDTDFTVGTIAARAVRIARERYASCDGPRSREGRNNMLCTDTARRERLACLAALTALSIGCACDPMPATPDARVIIVDGEGGPTDPDAGSDGGAPDAERPDAGGDDGAIDGARGDSGLADGAVPTRAGMVVISQARTPSPFTFFAAGFFDGLSIEDVRHGTYPGCEALAVAGACTVQRCVSSGDGPALATSGAGTMSASIDGTAFVTVEPSATGAYSATLTRLAFESGDEIEVAATGDVVPAFSATVVGPGELVATLPETVSRDDAWGASWTIADATSAQVTVVSGATIVRCEVPATDGHVDVPAELLGMLEATTTASVSIAAFNRTELVVGEHDLVITAADAVSRAITLE
jgi:hypothetical protein